MRFSLLLLAIACLPQVGPPVDGGAEHEDGGASPDGGPVEVDAGDPGCPGFAGCTTFTDGTTITFPNGNDTYAPKCLRIRAGQAVTFTGDRGNHPLRFVCGPSTLPSSASQVTLSVPGVWGYYCSDHGTASGGGMAGAIEVVP